MTEDKYKGIGYAIAINAVKLSPEQMDSFIDGKETEKLLTLAKGMTILMFEKDEFLNTLKADKEFSDKIMHETEDWIKVLLDTFPERKAHWVVMLQACMIVGVMNSKKTGDVTELAYRILGPIGFVLKGYGFEDLQKILSEQDPGTVEKAVKELIVSSLLRDILSDPPETEDGDEIIEKVNKILNNNN